MQEELLQEENKSTVGAQWPFIYDEVSNQLFRLL